MSGADWGNLRIHADLLERIRVAAEADRRSMARWAEITLMRALDEQEACDPAAA